MVINKEFTAICRGCKQKISVYNYVGLGEDSLMGSHHCSEISEFLAKHPRVRMLITNLKEVKKKCNCFPWDGIHAVSCPKNTPIK